jgi:hypothetical protein
MTAAAICAGLAVPPGLSAEADTITGSTIAGRSGVYDYSPSVMVDGNTRKYWWCGTGTGPDGPTDTIQYQSENLTTGVISAPATVFARSADASAWDSNLTCNPSVVKGTFANPLGNGQNYTYAMYYAANKLGDDEGKNSIGVAFSNDGVNWVRRTQPVIRYSTVGTVNYGVAQPSAWNGNGGSHIDIFFEENGVLYRVSSVDGTNFDRTQQVTISQNGLSNTSVRHVQQRRSRPHPNGRA